MADSAEFSQSNRPHRKKSHALKRKANKEDPFNDEANDTKEKNVANDEGDDDFKKSKLRNPRAFALQSFVAAERQFRRLVSLLLLSRSHY